MQRIVFIDRRVQDSIFVDSVNSDTFPIVYDETTDSESVLALLAENQITLIERIAFVFHGPSSNTLFEPKFLVREPFFTTDDLLPDDILPVVEETIEFPKTSSNVSFVNYLIQQFSVTHIDFLACNLLLLDHWKSYFKLFPSVTIGASDDNTGNLKFGGDWILESTMEDVQRIYFTEAIENYTLLLVMPTAVNTYYHVFYTVSNLTPTIMTRTTYDNSGINILDSTDISFGGMNVVDVLQIMDGSGTNPYTIGIVDSSLNKASMDIAYCSAYSKALTTTQQKTVMNYANTFKEPHTAATIFTVTVSGGVYSISTNGATTVSKPSLTLAVGMYVFDQSHSSNVGFPLRLSTTASSPSYDVGVVINGTPGYLNAYTLIDVTAATTLPLYYYSPTAVNMGPVPLLPLIWYTFETSNLNVVANSGTAGIAGNATIIQNGASKTISYNTVSTYVKKGTMSLYNSALATGTSSSYVQLPNVLLTGNGFTFCVWMYLINYNTVSSVHHIIFRFKFVNNNVGELDVIVRGELNPPVVTIGNFTTPNIFGSAAVMKTSWQHIAFTMNKTSKLVKVYTNGQYQNNFTATVIFPSNTSEFQFMHDGPYSSSYTSLYGYVDDYRIYDSELTAADILSIYNS
jgi:hypothetical protein